MSLEGTNAALLTPNGDLISVLCQHREDSANAMDAIVMLFLSNFFLQHGDQLLQHIAHLSASEVMQAECAGAATDVCDEALDALGNAGVNLVTMDFVQDDMNIVLRDRGLQGVVSLLSILQDVQQNLLHGQQPQTAGLSIIHGSEAGLDALVNNGPLVVVVLVHKSTTLQMIGIGFTYTTISIIT